MSSTPPLPAPASDPAPARTRLPAPPADDPAVPYLVTTGPGLPPVVVVGPEREDVGALLDAAGGRGVLLGEGTGAFHALRAAARLGSGRVPGVVAYEPSAAVGPGETPAPAPVARDDRAESAAAFLRGLGLPDRYVPGMRRTPSWAALEALLPARWADITQPVLVADGAASPCHVRAAADALAQVLPNARRVTLGGPEDLGAAIAETVAACASDDGSRR